MHVQVESINNLTIVSVEGRLDTTNAGELEKPVVELIEGGCTGMILDCSKMNYISSSGLRVFLVAQKKMKAIKGHLSICSLQPAIREIFDISGFTVILSVFPDRESAINNKL